MNPVLSLKPVEKELLNPYDNSLFSLFPEGVRPGGLLLTERLIESAGFKNGARILDTGCGQGISIELLERKYLFKAAGIDISGSLLINGLSKFPFLKLVQGDAGFLPFKNESFDGVIAECSLSATGNINRVLKEIGRVLGHGGRLAMSDIYIRNGTEAGTSEGNPPGVLSGALTYSEIIKNIEDSELKILEWKDYSQLWREFIAGLILNDVPVCGLFKCGLSGENNMKAFMNAASALKPGYFSLIAEKR